MTTAQQYLADPPWQIIGGAVAAIGAITLAVCLRRYKVKKTAVAMAVVIALGSSVESAWRFAGVALHLHGVWRAVPAVMFESAAVATAARAAEFRAAHPDKRNPYLAWVWGFAVVAGLAPALSSTSLPEAIFRFLIPMVAAALWFGDFITDEKTVTKTSWILTPRRIGVMLHLLQPGDGDITTVHREHQIRALTVAAFRLHHGGWLAQKWYGWRIQRLALAADDDMVEETRDRVTRAHYVHDLTRPPIKLSAEVRPDVHPVPPGRHMTPLEGHVVPALENTKKWEKPQGVAFFVDLIRSSGLGPEDFRMDWTAAPDPDAPVDFGGWQASGNAKSWAEKRLQEARVLLSEEPTQLRAVTS